MTVHCPSCLAGYEVPERLLGRGGARVRCPACGDEFRIGGAPAPQTAESGAPTSRDPATVGAEVLAVLVDFLGEDLARSRARGTVLSDHGPALMAGWDEYQRRAGHGAPARPFLIALRDRCGVDLTRAGGR